MKHTATLFKGSMVCGILDDRKTQTRRPVKGTPLEWLEQGFTPEYVASPENNLCPYGNVGDRLWVKETWQYYDWTEEGEPKIRYAADGATLWMEPFEEHQEKVLDIWAKLSEPANYDIDGAARDRKWRPSIFMPRWASRILLEIVSIRVERLKDISEEDAMAEGFQKLPATGRIVLEKGGQYLGMVWPTARAAYRDLWEAINGDGAWEANPYVWVIEFKKVKA